MLHSMYPRSLYRHATSGFAAIPVISSLLIVCSHAMGCATVIKGSTQVIPVTSSPSRATLVVDGAATYTTPCSISLKRKSGHQLVFQKPGYEDLTYQVHTETSAAVAGNILLGGLIGLGVDAATGASNNLVPASVNVTLTPLELASSTVVGAVSPVATVMPTELCDISALPSPPGKNQVSLAVVDFSVGLEMQKETGRAIGDICRNVVQGSRHFILLDRENMVSILGEQDFAEAVKCDETACLVQYGRLLSVQKMLYGRVSPLGSSCVVYLGLTDVETGRIEATVTEQVEGSIDGLGRLMPTLACNLLKSALSESNTTGASGDTE